MKVKPEEFSCPNMEADDVILHVQDEEGFLAESILFVNMWKITIEWGGEKLKIGQELLPDMPTENRQYISYEVYGTVGRPDVELRLRREPCHIDGCLVITKPNGIETSRLFKELLTQETAWEFCRQTVNPRLSKDDPGLIELALKVYGLFRDGKKMGWHYARNQN